MSASLSAGMFQSFAGYPAFFEMNKPNSSCVAMSSDFKDTIGAIGGDRTETCLVRHCKRQRCQYAEEELIGEEPLVIRAQDRPYAVVMRTPGEENFHVAGFCLTEGLVDCREDILTLGYCDENDTNVAEVTFRPERHQKIKALLARRGFISQTSCGLCGKELIEDLCQALTPSSDKTMVTFDQILDCAEELPRQQRLYGRTGGSHGAMIFDKSIQLLAVSEDVGRHNALDKAIGKILLDGVLDDGFLGILSSRISYELVQKAARAQLPILVSMSRPTALAVALGRSLNMTLACLGKKNEILVFCGENRLHGGSAESLPEER
jgi:FdhD protein